MRTPRFIACFIKFVLLLAALTIGGGAFAQTALNLPLGWSLLGNSGVSPIDVATTFGDATKISTVWKWNKTAPD